MSVRPPCDLCGARRHADYEDGIIECRDRLHDQLDDARAEGGRLNDKLADAEKDRDWLRGEIEAYGSPFELRAEVARLRALLEAAEVDKIRVLDNADEVARLREALAVCARAGCPEAGRATTSASDGDAKSRT